MKFAPTTFHVKHFIFSSLLKTAVEIGIIRFTYLISF